MNKKNVFALLGAISMSVFVFTVAVSTVFAQDFAQINSNTTLKAGSKGNAVTAMQNFLASNHDIYPGGLVTGYFGTMTKEAVIQFQLNYDLTPDGIVGVGTRSKMNAVIAAGRGIDIYGPSIINPTVSVNGRNATLSFSSNEPVSATAFYDTNPLGLQEASLAFTAPVVSGYTTADASFGVNKQIILSNLVGNSVYNYTLMARDASGNVSLVWPKTLTSGQ